MELYRTIVLCFLLYYFYCCAGNIDDSFIGLVFALVYTVVVVVATAVQRATAPSL